MITWIIFCVVTVTSVFGTIVEINYLRANNGTGSIAGVISCGSRCSTTTGCNGFLMRDSSVCELLVNVDPVSTCQTETAHPCYVSKSWTPPTTPAPRVVSHVRFGWLNENMVCRFLCIFS